MPRELKKPADKVTYQLQAMLTEKEYELIFKACRKHDTTRSKYGRKAIINQLREDGYDV